MSTLREHTFSDPEVLAEVLARDIADDLATALAARDTAGLVVSGGSTPLPLFTALAKVSLPWNRVVVTLADERWVPPSHEASNEGLVRRHLLTGQAAEACFVPLWNDAHGPEQGRDACERALEAVPHPFDVLVLGMGGDGHTASLFPGAAELAAGLDPANEHRCLAVTPTDAPHPRMSLTLAALVSSRRVILHLTGDEKRRVLDRALGEGPEDELPIRAVLRRAPAGVDLYWAP